MKISRRRFLATSSVAALSLGVSVRLACAAPTVSDVWMETPDVLAFTVSDGTIFPGNIVPLSTPDSAAYDKWVLRSNPRSGHMEYCAVIGLDKMHLRFADQPSPMFVDRAALRNVSKYQIVGGAGLKVTAVYYRDEADGQGELGHQKVLLLTMRHTIYLQLANPPIPGVNYTIRHLQGAIANFQFTFDDKKTRAGGIKSSSAGHKRGDNFKYAYLCSRLPHAPNHGAVDFAGTYDVKTFYIIDQNGRALFQGPITLRRAWNQLEADDGYINGIDVADLSQSWTVTNVTKGNPTIVTCPGHPFANGDKVRFRGMSGMWQLDGAGATGGAGLWVAATARVIDGNSFTVNIDSRSFSDLTTTDYKPSLGGVLNQVYKCFNTNRAATSVWGMDYGTFQPAVAGEFRIYIPKYGVSDPIHIDDAAWAVVAGKHHEGLYNLRLGCETDRSSNYSRAIALKDGVNGCTNYWSTLPAIFGSEFSSNSFGPKAKSGDGAYAKGSKFGPGFITNKRALYSRPAHQDAGDNDDIGADHLGAITMLAWVFHELPKASRHLTFTVQSSAAVLDPKLFAQTDTLPALFHELAWHLEAYRTQQNADGSAPGGWGLGHFSSQTPNYPEPIQYYRGTDAGGIYIGQTVMAYLYASDHFTNMLLAGAFGKFAQIAYDYGLAALGDAYKRAAVSAYDWADRLLTDPTARDNYYIGQLDIKTKMGWDDKTYRSTIERVNRTTTNSKYDVCGILYRLFGSVHGQDPYGKFIDAHIGSMNNRIGGWDYLMTPGANERVRNYCLAHAYDGFSTRHFLSTETCFNPMMGSNSRTGGSLLLSPHQMILAHMTYVLQNGRAAGHKSDYLKSLQAGLGFMLGANQPGKAFMTGFGPRPYACILHEDSYKMGVPAPPGITPFGYFAWASGLIVFNYGSGPNCDGPLQWIAGNVSGNWETPPNSGSHKMDTPWRFGSGYWEWAPENKGLIFQSEFSLPGQINSLISSLYLHGWDGNTSAKLSH